MSLCRLFLHEKTVEIILRILEAEKLGKVVYLTQLSNDVGSPYSYVSRIIKQFEENTLVETKVEGRMRFVKLTEFGKRVAELLYELRRELTKDFRGRYRLRILREVMGNGGDFRSLAGVIAELEALKKSSDEYVRREAEEMLKKVVEMVG